LLKRMPTYTAQYSATARVFYTITFNANGGAKAVWSPQRFEVGVDTALEYQRLLPVRTTSSSAGTLPQMAAEPPMPMRAQFLN
jgi:hypothetical protein